MSTDSTTGTGDESIVEAAARHRDLHTTLAAADQVTHVDTVCHGANVPDDQPRFETEIVLAPEYDAVGPVVLEAIADADLGIEIVQPQGPPGQRSLVATVRR